MVKLVFPVDVPEPIYEIIMTYCLDLTLLENMQSVNKKSKVLVNLRKRMDSIESMHLAFVSWECFNMVPDIYRENLSPEETQERLLRVAARVREGKARAWDGIMKSSFGWVFKKLLDIQRKRYALYDTIMLVGEARVRGVLREFLMETKTFKSMQTIEFTLEKIGI